MIGKILKQLRLVKTAWFVAGSCEHDLYV